MAATRNLFSKKCWPRWPRLLGLLFGLSAAQSAQALPVSQILDVPVGSERFVRVPPGSYVVIEPSDGIKLERLPSEEVLLLPQAPGRYRLFVMGKSGFEVATLRVKRAGASGEVFKVESDTFDRARKSCGLFKQSSSAEGFELEAEVSAGDCRAQLLALFRDDRFLRKNVAVSYSPEALRDQLLAIEARKKAAGLESVFQLSYAGPNLRLRGKATQEQTFAMLRIAWEETVGSFLFENQIELLASPGREGPAPTAQPKADTPAIPISTIAEFEREQAAAKASNAAIESAAAQPAPAVLSP